MNSATWFGEGKMLWLVVVSNQYQIEYQTPNTTNGKRIRANTGEPTTRLIPVSLVGALVTTVAIRC